MPEQDVKQTTVRIDSELYKRFKRLLVDQESTMNDVICELIERYVNEHEQEAFSTAPDHDREGA